MSFGVRVTNTEKDAATLGTLATRAPHLVDAAWEERRTSTWTALVSDAFTEELALDLLHRGLDVVRLVPPGTPARREAIPALEGDAEVRKARGLLEAVRPLRTNDNVPAEAWFFCQIEGGAAQRTLESLLLLDRGDAHIAEVDTSDGHMLVVHVREPPLYLLLKAREEASAGVRAYTRATTGARLLTAWGTKHPLAALLEDRLAKTDRTALVDADGKTTLAPALWPLRPILDGVRPDLNARKDVLEPVQGSLSFPVRLRMGPADEADPELWLLSPEDLARLETFVDASPADDVGRLLVSRVASLDGRARYVLREAVRPQVARLGPRVASLLEKRGFVRAPALDNLYLPPGRRLVPSLSREQLKQVLGLDAAAAVIVDEDGDGLAITAVRTLEDAPLSRFTTWIATDRRAELDRLLEDAALSFPGVVVEKPERAAPVLDDVTDPKRAAMPRSPRDKPAVRAPTKGATGAGEDPAERDVAALRKEARMLEEKVLTVAATDPTEWRSLGLLKRELDELDDAASCLEVSLFLGAPADAVCNELAQTRALLLDPEGRPPAPGAAAVAPTASTAKRAMKEPALLDLAVRDSFSRDDAGLLGARLVQALARGEPVLEDIIQQTSKVFLRDDILISRRLQWAVLHAINARAKDALGATRAKEAVLGALNARGLSETLDLPRFVRTSLALTTAGDNEVAAPLDRARHEQLVQLEKLFGKLVEKPLAITDARQAFFRAVFAVGLARLGGRGAEIARSIEGESDAHDPPNRVLLRLYAARMGYFVTSGSMEGWKGALEANIATLARPEDKRVVEWLVKRSLWLRPAPPEDPPPGLRPALERHLATAERSPDELPSATTRVQEMPGLYDYEVATALERTLKGALATGRDELIRATLNNALKGLSRIKILAHKVRALGSCVKAAATLEDGELLDQCLEGISSAARSPNVPSVRDLLVAVKPALAALRRLGAVDAAQRFLSNLEPVAAAHSKETGPLLAALSDGFLQLGDVDKAKELVAAALQRALASTTGHVDRYEAGVAVLEALAHWDLDARVAQCEVILAELPKFTDTFTTSRYFSTHQILITERLVETIVDDVTLRSDRLQAYLDGEEQIIRRRILQQWSALCGR